MTSVVCTNYAASWMCPRDAAGIFGPDYKERSELAVEHRLSDRKPIRQRILVHRGAGAHSRLGETHDLSMDGAFVRMDAKDLTPAASIDMLIALRAGEFDEMHRLPARIVRVSPNGVGLQFAGYGDKTYTALINLLCLSGTFANSVPEAESNASAPTEPRVGERNAH